MKNINQLSTIEKIKEKFKNNPEQFQEILSQINKLQENFKNQIDQLLETTTENKEELLQVNENLEESLQDFDIQKYDNTMKVLQNYPELKKLIEDLKNLKEKIIKDISDENE